MKTQLKKKQEILAPAPSGHHLVTWPHLIELSLMSRYIQSGTGPRTPLLPIKWQTMRNIRETVSADSITPLVNLFEFSAWKPGKHESPISSPWISPSLKGLFLDIEPIFCLWSSLLTPAPTNNPILHQWSAWQTQQSLSLWFLSSTPLQEPTQKSKNKGSRNTQAPQEIMQISNKQRL